MPTYDYVCKSCEHRFEHFQTMTSDTLTQCPECKEESLKRLIGTGAALIFKGSGFYCTDYKKPSPDAAVERTKEAAKIVKDSSGGGSGGESSSASTSEGSSNKGSTSSTSNTSSGGSKD
jgi:putative FmdB family regulatory protein